MRNKNKDILLMSDIYSTIQSLGSVSYFKTSFLKVFVTLKTGVMTLKIQLRSQE